MDAKEKWADKVAVRASSAEEEERIRAAFSGPLPDPYGVSDLIKTDAESAELRRAVAGLNRLRQVMCGLPPLVFSDERLHVVGLEEFRQKVSSFGEGKTMLGHIYIWRGMPAGWFSICLTHEIVHAAGYLELSVTDPKLASGRPAFTFTRSGMLKADPTFGLRLPHFHGLNEAVTETAAILMRRILDPSSDISFPAYDAAVMLIDHVIAAAAGPGGDTVVLWQMLLRDYFLGTDAFLEELERKMPGAVDVLRATGARPGETAVAADKLGFSGAAAKMRRLAEIHGRK